MFWFITKPHKCTRWINDCRPTAADACLSGREGLTRAAAMRWNLPEAPVRGETLQSTPLLRYLTPILAPTPSC